MRILLLALLLPAAAMAGPVDYTPPPGDNSQAITPASVVASGGVTAATLSASTATLSLSGANSGALFPYSPLMVFGNANTYLQFVLQNISNGNNASGDIVLVNDLGGDTSYYLDIGANSSKFSQAGQTVEASSSTFLASSDSDLILWAGTNGGLNNGASETVIIGSSNPVTGNRAAVFSSSTVNVLAPLTISSAAIMGLHVSTQAAGGAGIAVTALCQTNVYPAGTTFVVSGGCGCTGVVAATNLISQPNCQTTGCIATGWTCQETGGTGATCTAQVICSRAQ